MGSTDHRQGLARVHCLGYATTLELAPQPSTSLEEQERTPGARELRPNTMAAQACSGGELPLEELLALYGYDMSRRMLQQPQASQIATTLPETTVDKIAKDLFSGEEDEDTRSSADDLAASVTSRAADLVRCHIKGLPGEDKDAAVSSSDEDSDGTSGPSNDGRKDIMVGPQYQVNIPSLSSATRYERAYESEDQLLWTPGMLSAPTVEEFLLQVQRCMGQAGDVDALTSGDLVKDNEQALYELVKCNFNTDEALRRLCFNVKVFSEELCAWSEEECRNFEHGYRVHGKNFHLIQANKVRTRSVGECVQYYYMWKKSERHEYFTQQATKLGRRKYPLQSGTMEDGDADIEHGEVDSPSLQLRPPSPPAVLQAEQQGAELEIRERELCAEPPSSLQREPSQSFFLPQRPVADRLGPASVAALPRGRPYASTPLHQRDPDVLGSGLHHLQLGSSVGHGAPSRSSGPRPTDLFFPQSPTPPPAIAPPTAVPDFGGVLYRCPGPIRQPRPLTQ
ncbi:mesoderm induction early response protein 2 isoform X2 [Electrophorus electricus]|uniref:mesoderm induction early response protein 2 isoform X2 n=1 Tax=Electrophorus electricus TaxID=8005 RepID=UPI0015D02267|nr:mesoderm induction early response protein 2 isoform X2 [Electrophorus electricus]